MLFVLALRRSGVLRGGGGGGEGGGEGEPGGDGDVGQTGTAGVKTPQHGAPLTTRHLFTQNPNTGRLVC